MVGWLWGVAACTWPSGERATAPEEDRQGPADLVVFADVGLAVVGDRIEEVFEEAGRARLRMGKDTVVLRAERVTPGFVDSHVHPVGYGRQQSELDLVGAASYADTLARVEAAAAGEGWLRGRGWDQNDWADAPEGGWPRAADLDAIVGERPVALRRIDGHAVWVSSAALAAAGILASTPDPEGGRIVRGPDGAPTGVLVDTAADLLPEEAPSKVQIRRWAVAGLEALARTGLTGAHVMGADDDTLEVLSYLDRKDRLPLRLWVYVDPDSEAAERLKTEGPWAGQALQVRGVKAYADGALGSRGALLREPYADEPGHVGLAVTSPEALGELAVALTASGAQLAVHAIGDLGVKRALDAVSEAREAHPEAEVRHRVEHAQVVHPEDVPRFAALRVIASVQPSHATSDRPWVAARLGEARVPWSYAWKTLAEAGATLAFGSDAPVEDPAPAEQLWAATRRQDARGLPEGGWRPEEAVSLEAAVEAFTRGAAKAVHDEERLGALEVGQLADLSLWSTSGERFAPVATVVGGKVVYQRPGTGEAEAAPPEE